MKYTIILLAILIFVGGYYFLAGPPSRVVNTETIPEPVVEEALPTNEAGEPPVEEPVEEPGETLSAEPGDDAGMEFPIPDMGIDLETKTFDLVGFNYGYDVEEIRVSEGDTVTINLTVSEGFHDWVVDEFEVATEKIRPEGFSTITFVADKAGTYEYYCSVGSHRAMGMVGKLVVE